MKRELWFYNSSAQSHLASLLLFSYRNITKHRGGERRRSRGRSWWRSRRRSRQGRGGGCGGRWRCSVLFPRVHVGDRTPHAVGRNCNHLRFQWRVSRCLRVKVKIKLRSIYSGGSRISQRGPQLPKWVHQPIISQIFPENCMLMKEFRPRTWRSPITLIGSANDLFT